MIEKFKAASAVIGVFVFGALIGAGVLHTYSAAHNAEGIARQAVSINDGIKKDLNERVLPEIQKQIGELRVAKK